MNNQKNIPLTSTHMYSYANLFDGSDCYDKG